MPTEVAWAMATEPAGDSTRESDAAVTNAGDADRARSGWLVGGVVAIGLVGAVIGGVFAWALLLGGGGTGPVTHTYVVEAGTGARLDQGVQIDLMPTEVRLAVGDTLVIQNDDDRDYMVGPYSVRAGETIEQTFQRAQILVGECSLSGSGEVQIIVM